MSATAEDIIIEQGVTWTYTWTVLNKQMETGYTFAAKFRGQHSSTGTILSVTNFVATHDGNHTDLTLTLTAAQTGALAAPYLGVYDIEYTQTSTQAVTRAFEGSFYVTPEATR